MNTFPLIRTRWSNELVMALLYIVLILYHIPGWINQPDCIMNFLQLSAIAVLFDAAANIIRYKRVWCCVSGAVTAAIISLLTFGMPLWQQLIGVMAALIIGKYLWGGTGKNIINPALTGLLLLSIIWNIPYPFLKPSYLLLPAILLSLPFLKLRPYAGIGFLIGGLAALFIHHDLSIAGMLSDGLLFWSCIIMTDPVTVTGNRMIGSFAGFLGGFAIWMFGPNTWNMIAAVLAINIASYVVDSSGIISNNVKTRFNINKAVSADLGRVLDLTEKKVTIEEAELGVPELSAEEIIRMIKYLNVFGMGGAAFPAHKKITAVRQSKAQKKYLIINGVECDPGLFHDNYILIKFNNEIQKGIEALKNCIDFTSIFLAVRSTEGLSYPEEIKIYQAANRYPAGEERRLIQDILKVKLDRNQFPAEQGILVFNVQTVYSIYQAIYLNHPADTRYLTVANLFTKSAVIAKVPMGMKLRDIVRKIYPRATQIFVGGGIMQAHAADVETVADNNTNFIAIGRFPRFKESPQCSGCGDCDRHCPAALKVKKIADLVDQGKLKEVMKYNPAECISCGSCSYFCLAGRNLAQKIYTAKCFTADTVKQGTL